MDLVRLRSLFLVPCVAAVLMVGCGQGNTYLYPTAPTGTLGSTAFTTDGAAHMAVTALSAGDFTALGRGGDGKGKEGDSSDSDSHDHGKAPESPGHAPDHPGHGNRGELSGFVTAVTGDSLTVRGITVMVQPATVIRHGNRVLTMADIHVGDHVQARGTLDGTSLVATEIKVEGTEGDNDGDAAVKGTVSGLTGACQTLTFTVGTTHVTTTSTTVFDDVTCATLANGATVEVEGTRQADGSIVATKVGVKRGSDEVEGKVSGLTGTCPSLTFTVGATHVTATSTTTFTGVTCVAITNGARVEVEGTRQADRSITAASVKLD